MLLKLIKRGDFVVLTLMSPIFDMRPPIAYQALRREKSPDFDATNAHSLNFAPSAFKTKLNI